MENQKHEWFRLSEANAKRLLIYLIVNMLAGLLCTLLVMFDNIAFMNNMSVINKAIVGSMAAGLLGSSIFYGRKLYKSCINLDMVAPNPTEKTDGYRELGIIFYFLLRPLFSIAFGVLIVILIKSGCYLISGSNNATHNLIHSVMAISFFVGYSSGDFIDVLETKSKHVAKSIIPTSENHGKLDQQK